MLENLIDLVKQNAGSAIINNPAIPNEHNDAAINVAGSSIVDGLKKMISQGNVQDVVNLFNHQGGDIANTPATQQLSGGLIQNLMEKFGLDKNAASGITSNLLPQVLQKLVHKTNDPNDSSFDIQSILSNVTSGQDSNNFDLQSIIGKFTQGGNNSNSGESKGIMDTVTQLFGK
jgi:uncharacterized protein YidB (DUF937 family)